MFISEGGSNTERTFKLVPTGSHLAICYGIVDLGTQQYVYQGEQKAGKMLRLLFELHGEDGDGQPLTLDDGRPLSISQRYTKSLHEKAKLRQHIVSWRGGKDLTPEELGQVPGQTGYNIRTLIGKHCMLTVKHSLKADKTFANVDGITQVPAVIRKLGLPDMVNSEVYFSFDSFSMDELNKVSQGLQKVIMLSPEYQRASTSKPARPSKQAEAEDWFDKHEKINANKGMEDDDDQIPF
jgi:hypothetical protein